MEIDVPVSVAYNCYSDREAIPRWMPFISSVKVWHKTTLKQTLFLSQITTPENQHFESPLLLKSKDRVF